MGLAKWQNITQPSGSKFDFLLWEFLFGCHVENMHAFIKGDIFLGFFYFGRKVLPTDLNLTRIEVGSLSNT